MQGRLPSCVGGRGAMRTRLSVREAARVGSSLIFYELAGSTDVFIILAAFIMVNEPLVVRVYPV